MSGARLAGAYGMLAWQADAAGDRVAIGWAQFGPISRYPRAQIIRERYPSLPESPAPWVVTCLQVVPGTADRDGVGAALLRAVCEELDRRGIIAVEAYPEGVANPWAVPQGPATVYDAAGFTLAAGEDQYPVYRRELEGGSAEVGWGDLLSHTKPADEGQEWPLPLPKGPSEEDVFRLPPKPTRPNRRDAHPLPKQSDLGTRPDGGGGSPPRHRNGQRSWPASGVIYPWALEQQPDFGSASVNQPIDGGIHVAIAVSRGISTALSQRPARLDGLRLQCCRPR